MKLATGQDIAAPRGCWFSAVAAGIKKSGNADLAIAGFNAPASAAAMFTRNRVVAAPVEVGRKHLAATRGRVQAVLVNSGNANCATGEAGRHACEAVCRALAKSLGVSPAEIFPSSTGIIGVPLPAEKIRAALPELLARRQPGVDGLQGFARAIMTTDTRPKLASVLFSASGSEVTLAGVAKGAGMIHPNLATMLVYLITDVAASARELRAMLTPACNESFNCISIDGDTSTNDTVLLAATGASGVPLADPRVRRQFAQGLNAVCGSLAGQIVADGEGVTHRVTLRIEQARGRAEALQVARTIAHSPLVKTAWAGADPNWGRILAAAGRSGVAIDPRRVHIFLGPHQVCRNGMKGDFDERAAHQYLTRPAYEIRVQLGRGRASLRFLTCDLTTEYVHINADYST